MFTGIITDIGTVAEMSPKEGGGARVAIKTPWDCEAIDLGASRCLQRRLPDRG